MTNKFRKKPVEIDAVCWQGTVTSELHDIMDGWAFEVYNDSEVIIPTPEGIMTANLGDWIIRGVAGEVYPCKPDIFEATYERVDDDAP